MARKAGPGNKKYYSMRLIVGKQADGLVLYGLTLHNSPTFILPFYRFTVLPFYRFTVNQTDGFTAWGLHLLTPTVHGTDARNTDGIDPSRSTNITQTHSWIHNDDDNVAIKDGVSYISVLHNHFYNGHDMSIDSETLRRISHLLVDDLMMDHTNSNVPLQQAIEHQHTRFSALQSKEQQAYQCASKFVPMELTILRAIRQMFGP